jgi:lambda family phage portal protein
MGGKKKEIKAAPAADPNGAMKRYQAAKHSNQEYRRYWARMDVNNLIKMDGPLIRERVRYLVRNFPPFGKAIESHSAFVIGKGGRFESMALTVDRKNDEELRKVIEEGFGDWMSRCSYDGRMSFYDCQRLAYRQKLEAGEFFCILNVNGKGSLALQFVEPDNVRTDSVRVDVKGTDKTVVYDGIELDRLTGERVAYYVEPYNPDSLSIELVRIKADDMIHGYSQHRPNQLRGVSPFAACVILGDCMFDYIEAELDAARMSSKWLGFVKSPDPGLNQLAKGLNPNEKKELEFVENCTLEYLRPGEDVTFQSTSTRVTENFDRFTKFVMRQIGLVIGVPYEIISGDYQDINYSTSRMNRQDYEIILKPERYWLEENFNKPVFRAWLKLQALKDTKYFKDYFRNPWRYEDVLWIPAGMPSPDPLKEGKADIDAIKSGTMAPQEVILARGADPERVIAQRSEWKKMEEEGGLKSKIEEVSTDTQTNPAAMEDEKGDNGKEV